MQTSENIELRTKYLNETKSLLPCSSNAEEWAIEVEKIRCFSLPSILESLQYGFMSQEGRGAAPEQLAPRRMTTLSSGFPEEAKNTRFESIRHQHRMHWSISKFPRTEFYQASDGGERLQDANSTLNSRVNFTFLTNKSTLRQQERRYWIDVKDGHQDRRGNAAEVREAMNILSSFLDWFDSLEAIEFKNSSLVLLTPYVNQSRLLREAANQVLKKWNSGLRGTRANVLFKNGRKVVIFCSTVDKFQGQEADVVVFSLRNVHRQGNMDSPNRANVGLTRAREAMFVVGKKANYTKAFDPMLKRLAKDMSLGTSNNYWRKKA
jgi:superfamily I DNA and/or RNA helicase